MSLVNIVRPELRALKPYAAAAQVEGMVRLNANEMPWPRQGDNFRRTLNRYPEVRPTRLAGMLADRYSCAADELLVTRGTSEGIDLLMRVCCRAGEDSVLVPEPTFSMYRHYANIQGARLIEYTTSRSNNFAIDVDAMIDKCDATTRAIFVCSPNNPTGNLWSHGDLIRLLEARANQSAIIVDEAYIEFANRPSAIELLAGHDNLVVLRTLSKALACAGARCGSLIATAPFIELVSAVQAPYAMATPIVEIIENTLQAENLGETEQFARDIIHERDRLIAAMASFPFVQKTWSSAANFFLVQVRDAAALLAHCTRHQLLLRYFGGDLADCVRITVGSAEENRRLLAAFTELADTQA
ncbi:MAG: histidinol-phosphate transaminase [Gammaproteobacteria bacterium]|nr:histidinol-phosphate transaminase [Gammaproteobacteria bacterium]MDH5303047.1 histidinol-phosphate transaminase [Gammaproteobacteria bacterium]MDH5321209.1 histidinol-phosphate transaminase [Gammaproteobacteria bacterium]